MSGTSVPGGTDKSFPALEKSSAPINTIAPDPITPAALFWVLVRLLLFLPALAPLAAFLFASFWFASGILLGLATISTGLLGVFAAMLAFDCLPEGALREGPFGLTRRIPPNATGAAAASEFGLSLIFQFYLIYAAIFWVFALTIAAIAARLFLF